MKRYESYKDSGIGWIGEIPSHWGVEPFGRHFSYGKGLPITKADLLPEGIAVISYGQIHSKNNTGTKITEDLVRHVSPEYLKSNPQALLKTNDFIFADTSEDIEGSGNCAFNDYHEDIFAGYHTVVARPLDLQYPKYYAYLFQSQNWKNQVQSLVNGVKVYSINKGILKKSALLFPSLSEQKAIVAFLDDKTARVDGLVSQVEREIELLKEYKQAEIARVVTKGLNPHAPMKPSGIFWQPFVPDNWRVTRLKNVIIKLNRQREPGSELLVCSNSGDVKKRGDSKLGLVAENENIYQGVKQGDLLIHGMDTWHGAIAVSEYFGMCTPVVHVCDSSQNKDFIALYLRNMATQKIFKLISNGVRQNTSDFRSWDKLASIPIVLPSIQEQNDICSHIKQLVSRIKPLVEKLLSQIEHLKEYKQRLIADVVTGKINVQNN